MLAGGGVKRNAETDLIPVWVEPQNSTSVAVKSFSRLKTMVGKDTRRHIAQGPQVNTTSRLYVIVTQLQNLSWKGGKSALMHG